MLLGPGARGRLSVPLARIDFQVRTVVDHMMPLRDLGCRACHLPAPTLAGPGTLESRPCVEVLLASTRRVGPRSPGRRLGGSPPLSGTRLGCSPGHTTGMHAPRRAPPCHWQWELNFNSRRRAGLTVGSLQARLRGLGLATGSGLQRPGVHTGQVSFATTAVGPKAPGRRQSESTDS